MVAQCVTFYAGADQVRASGMRADMLRCMHVGYTRACLRAALSRSTLGCARHSFGRMPSAACELIGKRREQGLGCAWKEIRAGWLPRLAHVLQRAVAAAVGGREERIEAALCAFVTDRLRGSLAQKLIL
jgi:hypothetical protein